MRNHSKFLDCAYAISAIVYLILHQVNHAGVDNLWTRLLLNLDCEQSAEPQQCVLKTDTYQ